MRTARGTRTLVAVLLAVTIAGGCSPDDRVGSSRPLGSEPLSDDEVTLHLAAAPELPDSLAGAVVTVSELRAEDLTERHTVQLVEVPAGVDELDGALKPGAPLLVPEGVTVEFDAAVGTVALAGGDGAVAGVLEEPQDDCAAPCEVVGPALVVEAGWFEGAGARPGWQLLVPSPIEQD